MNQSYVGRILLIEPIEQADRLELATVVCGEGGKWRGVVEKGIFMEGSVVVVFLPDSILLPNEAYAFMEKRNWRVSFARFRGAPSECLILPYNSLFSDLLSYRVGTEVSERLGVTKYEKVDKFAMSNDFSGPRPWFVPKTDEPNVQAASELLVAMTGKPYIVTQKLDGASVTWYRANSGLVEVCSRNNQFKLSAQHPAVRLMVAAKAEFWKVSDFALQGELVGPKIQGNPLGLSEHRIYWFNLMTRDGDKEFSLCSHDMLIDFCDEKGLFTVPVLQRGVLFDMDVDDLQSLASGNYQNGHPQEGIVVRPISPLTVTDEFGSPKRVSFKVINLEYK